ncbi:MAG TPA: ureidoglycolate lyase [Burkholderiaceae bacterium]|nr:ureidoglycolate lyase [Burkholderiaceae bacterium]
MTTDTLTPVTLVAEPLTRDAFSPFGDVIEVSDAVKHFPINDGNTERYHDLANIDPGAGGRVIVSIFRGLPRRLPFELTMMERHPRASQAFIPISGRPYLVAVAPIGNAPTIQDIRVFHCKASQGVNYATGVWHHPLMALENTSDFLIIDRSGPGDNCDVIELEQRGVVVL